MIADGSHIGSPSDVFALLSSLHNDEEHCHTVIFPLLTKLAAISDWPPVQDNVWISAHIEGQPLDW